MAAKKFRAGTVIAFLLFTAMGFAGGVLLGSQMTDTGGFVQIALFLLFLCAAVFLQIIIHEAGHLVFGLMTGYGFSSFRIFSFMWIRQDGKICFRRHSLAGTGGQCLMVPPEPKDGKIPYILYNFGGSLLNVLTSVLFLGLSLLCGNGYCKTFLLMLVFAGTAFALTNGIPMQVGGMSNDGKNALSLGKDPEALRAFWLQMKMNEQLSRGIPLAGLPAEWFEMPSDESMKNPMIAAVGVFCCNRLMSERKFAEADREMERILSEDTAVSGLHRGLLLCDRIFCALLDGRETAGFLSKEQKNLMRSMSNFPSVIRTEYLLALQRGDSACAEKLMKRFEKVSHTYPYPADITDERAMIELAEARFSDR